MDTGFKRSQKERPHIMQTQTDKQSQYGLKRGIRYYIANILGTSIAVLRDKFTSLTLKASKILLKKMKLGS